MTTRVIILCPENNHLDVEIKVLNTVGVGASYHLTHGQSKELCVYDCQRLEVTEVPRKVAQ
jgi:hypothetical protein